MAAKVLIGCGVCVFAVMAGRYPIVVQGEASETDSDDEVYITSLPAPQTALIGAKVVLHV